MGVKPTITLIDLRHFDYEKDHFKIKSLKNTIEHRVGNYLSVIEVENLIAKDWTINVVAE